MQTKLQGFIGVSVQHIKDLQDSVGTLRQIQYCPYGQLYKHILVTDEHLQTHFRKADFFSSSSQSNFFVVTVDALRGWSWQTLVVVNGSFLGIKIQRIITNLNFFIQLFIFFFRFLLFLGFSLLFLIIFFLLLFRLTLFFSSFFFFIFLVSLLPFFVCYKDGKINRKYFLLLGPIN